MSLKHLKVLISGSDFPKTALKVLQKKFTVHQSRYLNYGDQLKQNHEELLSLIPGCSGLIWTYLTPISTELIDRAGPQLKIVSAVSTGYNHCNVKELKLRGIQLASTSGVVSSTVAEGAVSLMIAAARRFTENVQKVRSGQWELQYDKDLGLKLRGSIVGIIGLGDIGQGLIERLVGFQIKKIIYTGRSRKIEDTKLGAEFVPLNELLAQSDFVVVCLPLNNETRHIINKTTLAKMKSNAILVNVGRGDLVDQDALYETLKNKRIFGAAIDVMSPEPLPKDHKLLTLSNLFITPHIMGATNPTRNNMAALAVDNVINALEGKPLLTPVRF